MLGSAEVWGGWWEAGLEAGRGHFWVGQGATGGRIDSGGGSAHHITTQLAWCYTGLTGVVIARSGFCVW